MAAVVAGGVTLLGIAQGDTWLAVVAATLCGACLGFLPHNLSSPARIFLGDGGSMPIGFAVAALAMIGVSGANAAWQSLAMGLLFVGVPALDTALVVISRTRRGISILTGGRDHLTHRARQRLRTARAVALSLGGVQAVISALAVMAIRGGSTAVLGAVARVPRRRRRGNRGARHAPRADGAWSGSARTCGATRTAACEPRRRATAIAAAGAPACCRPWLEPVLFGLLRLAHLGSGRARARGARHRRRHRSPVADRPDRCARSRRARRVGGLGARLVSLGGLDRTGRGGGQPLDRRHGPSGGGAPARQKRPFRHLAGRSADRDGRGSGRRHARAHARL